MLSGDVPPGRYRLVVPVALGTLLADVAAAGWLGRVVDGAAMADRDGLFDEFAAALEFPGWFGRNWDAFLDCLRDLSWLRIAGGRIAGGRIAGGRDVGVRDAGEPGAGVVVLWRRSGAFATAAPRVWRDANEVIDEAIAGRVGARLPPLYVLLPARVTGPEVSS